MHRYYLLKSIFCLLLALLPYPLIACKYLPATVAFIILNDNNHDRYLNMEEWTHAQVPQHLEVKLKVGNIQEFNTIDHDKNGQLEAREIGFNRIQYKQPPCKHTNTNNFYQTP